MVIIYVHLKKNMYFRVRISKKLIDIKNDRDAQKMTVLYRRIIFEVLGIEKELCEKNLKTLIKSLDNWNNVQEKFLAKLN